MTRSSQTYINAPGAGQIHSDLCHFSQVLVLGNIAKCSGQGGWDNTGNCEYDSDTQVQHAFDNVDTQLRAAGFRGWEDVYSLRSYHVDIDASWQKCVEVLKGRIPGHRPIWTAVGVAKLAFPPMLIELEVEAIKQE